MLNKIKNQFEEHFAENMINVDFDDEKQVITEFFQDVYVIEAERVVDNILEDQVLKQNNILLREVQSNLLSV